MLPIVAGILTALAFASSTMTSARASRVAGPAPVLAGVMLVGLILVAPVALLLAPLPDDPRISPATFAIATLGGAANLGGLFLIYGALRIGAVGIVSTIASTEGAIAAVVSVIAGQTLAAGSGLVLGLIAFGVVLAASARTEAVEEGVRIPRDRALRAAAIAAAAAAIFGVGLYFTGQVSEILPPAWVILPGRILGVAVLTIPLLVAGRLRAPRSAVPLIVATGTTEVVGFALYAIGARTDIALTAVLASMFAPIAAVAAFVLFRERLARIQVVGIALVVAGVALLGWLSA
jgi:drug/metabolite transporter (DMT)-like permease